MRILLINPFYPISESPSPPLGLAYLAAALEQAGIDVRILDLVVYSYTQKRLETVLNDFSPDLVGITAVTMTFNHAARVLTDVKHLNPELKTVLGGPHATFLAEQILNDYPVIDFVVLGEGEATLVELARAVEAGREPADVAGLVYRDHGQIRATQSRPPGLDLNTLPMPARRLLPLGRYRALGMAISMTTSRGCPHQCIFCVGRKMVGARVRLRDAVKVVDEMEYLISLQFPQINLVDDLFTAKKDHCLAVCNEIMRRGLKTKWTSFARVDTVSPEVLDHMKAAGCMAVSFGVESGNQEILKTIKKKITLDQVVAAVKMCVAAGITPHASFILGLPGETPETMKETVAFGEKLKDLGVSHGFHLLAPFPGTLVREESEAYGLKILTNDWDQYHANRAIVETETVSARMLDETVIAWENGFNGYLYFLKERLDAGQATTEEAWPLLNLERIMLIYNLMMDEIIERHGTWPEGSGFINQDEALSALIDRVGELTGKPLNQVKFALDLAVEGDNLRCSHQNGLVRWAWENYL